MQKPERVAREMADRAQLAGLGAYLEGRRADPPAAQTLEASPVPIRRRATLRGEAAIWLVVLLGIAALFAMDPAYR